MRSVGRICCAYLKNRNDLFNNSSRNLVTSGLRTTPCIQQLEWEPTNFYNLASSQKRGYVPDPTSAVNKCWNCKKDTSEAMLCEHCNHLQDAKTDVVSTPISLIKFVFINTVNTFRIILICWIFLKASR